jgi:formylglycine-generating enzyme required for sulfatase activity
MASRNRSSFPLAAAALLSFCAQPSTGQDFTNSIGMRLVKIAPGTFRMGESATVTDELLTPLTYPRRDELIRRFPHDDPKNFHITFEAFRHGDFDERPVHNVTIAKPFFIGAFEVTNAQYEQFDPAHRALRGKRGFSQADDEAVIFVSWNEAQAFCDWLSKKEGRPYRLPTEAEWEYAARAATTSLFFTGSALPPSFLKNAVSTEFKSPQDVVSLAVGKTPPNPWGLFDMHGNVEEWTNDWYGPYQAAPQTDPAGHADGDFRVTRGGSHGVDPYYLRSANRMGALPETRNWLIGFRVVQAVPIVIPRAEQTATARQGIFKVVPPDLSKPYFARPRPFVKIPAGSHGPLYSHHNHDTAIAECPNGDLLAIWYTCEQERGRELAVASSRLRKGANEWEPAQPFWDTPDRNDHCPALWFDGKDTLYHFNGVSVAGKWEPLAIIMRTSKDSGITWSKARYIAPEFGYRNMVGQPVFRTKSGAIVFGADADGGSTIWVSRDEGATWADAGGNIRGIHAGIVETADGNLLALGRGQDIGGTMPVSVSSDMGKTWQSSTSALPPLGGGQRLVLMRLKEGPLFLASFAEDLASMVSRRPFTSIFGALSFDEGKTWPVRRFIAGVTATIDGGRVLTSESQGYLAATQARDGVIHLISSYNHYAFNVGWLKQPHPAANTKPVERPLAVRPVLAQAFRGAAIPVMLPLEGLDPKRGATIELSGAQELNLYVRTGPLTTNHYTVKPAAGRYRLAIRDDTAVQIYHDGKLIAVEPADLIIDWRQPARGTYLEWRSGASIDTQFLAIDLSGAYK